MHLPIQNIDSVYNTIYLFQRNPKTKQLEIRSDNNYIPYYYQKDDTGNYLTYDGARASRIDANIPQLHHCVICFLI